MTPASRVIILSEYGIEPADERIVVTRNYADFAILAETFARRSRPLAGILFLPSSLAHNDVAGHVPALLAWIDDAGAENPVRGTFGWLSQG